MTEHMAINMIVHSISLSPIPDSESLESAPGGLMQLTCSSETNQCRPSFDETRKNMPISIQTTWLV